MRYFEIINDSKLPSRWSKATLMTNGWREFGKGAYASVFEHPNKSYVLKIFSDADTAYLDFVNIVKQYPNKHFPKCGTIVNINDGHSAVKIEKLQPITHHYAKELKTIRNIVALLKYQSYETILDKSENEEGLEHWQRFITYLEQNPSMKDAILSLMPLFRKHFCDLGDSNFMLRGEVIVITDPVETIR